jgi:hypothetical protein
VREKGLGFGGWGLGAIIRKLQIPKSQIPKSQIPNSKFQIPKSKFQNPRSLVKLSGLSALSGLVVLINQKLQIKIHNSQIIVVDRPNFNRTYPNYQS